MDNTHLWNAVRYVERNPVRANLVGSPELYRWSSAPAHCGLREESILTPDFPPRGLVTDWSSWLKGELSQEELAAIRIATLKGIPYASEAFIRELEALLGVRIRPRK
jgi:putative transposase